MLRIWFALALLRASRTASAFNSTDDLGGLVTGNHADGSGATIGIHHGLFAGKSGVLQCFPIEDLGLYRIHLVERSGRDSETLSAQLILNITFAVDHMLLVPQYHAGIAVVDIDDHGGDLRVQFQQCLHKIILRG